MHWPRKAVALVTHIHLKYARSSTSLVPRVSPLPAPSLAPGGGKRRDPGNDVDLRRGFDSVWPTYWRKIVVFGVQWHVKKVYHFLSSFINAAFTKRWKSIFEGLNFKIFRGSMPPNPLHCMFAMISKTFTCFPRDHTLFQILGFTVLGQ